MYVDRFKNYPLDLCHTCTIVVIITQVDSITSHGAGSTLLGSLLVLSIVDYLLK